jgi:uncharacterized protein YegL
VNRSFFAAGAAGVVFLSGVSVWADVSVAWTAPPDGTTYPVGTLVNPVGAATASGSLGGSGLDLALVLDSSGSMTSTQGGKTRQVWQQEAAIGLVNGLPQGSSSVAVVEFDSDANLVRVLTPLVPDKGLVISAINSVDANGGTAIGTGIDLARQELTGVNATAGRTKVMVVISDGESSGNPGENADTARTAGVNQIHSVGIPGHDITTMQEIVDGLDDNFGVTPDNHGTYTGFDSADDLNLLLALFAGTGGTLVGIKSVDVTMPDGTILLGVQDGLGNFTVPEVGSWAIQAGANVFVANATADDGATKSATLTLYGEQPSGVPDFGSTLSMLGLGLFGLAPMLRRGRK